ncbi:MAG: hypothetical protein HC881_14020 [Leptolyngbyaceae cyanobacterium SL_7_1]|nr:hypothetical protein [Leptolyngbyaceae cyanobacterium SL_7_1]
MRNPTEAAPSQQSWVSCGNPTYITLVGWTSCPPSLDGQDARPTREWHFSHQ